MAKALVIHPEKCTGCRDCERACSAAHQNGIGSSETRIRVHTWADENISVPAACRQCNNASCAKVCPTNALRASDTIPRLIEYNPGVCLACELCTVACPFGAIRYDSAKRKVAKCDLCGGDPACVRACPSGAIEWVDDAAKDRPVRQAESPKPEGAAGAEEEKAQ